MADQRLVADLDGTASPGLIGDDETRLRRGEGVDHAAHRGVIRHVDASAGVLTALAGSHQADEQALRRCLLFGGETAVERVRPLLQRLFEASILRRADLGPRPLRPSLFERVLEQRQLADVILVALARDRIEADVADEFLSQPRVDPRAQGLGRPFDDVAKLGLVHRPEAHLPVLHRDAQAVMGLDVRIEVRADAEH
jgi:hypothetical protein